jgi:hypothetical protein
MSDDERQKACLLALQAALEYLDSPNFPHKSPLGNDRKPVVQVLRGVLNQYTPLGQPGEPTK